MILELDAGNTRIKWRLVNEADANTLASNYADDLDDDSTGAGLFTQISAHSLDDIKRIRVANVRGEKFKEKLIHRLSENWQLQPEFAQVQKQCHGVTNSYQDPQSMGVDRWLAMLSAYARTESACYILDCGSAMTFDWIDTDGNHMGGFIVPGLKLMQDSLARKSPALDVILEDWSEPALGKSTNSAISQGIHAMVTGFLRECWELSNKNTTEAEWFLTGGNAGLISKQLNWAHKLESDLVLDGLSLALP
ncbi:MAG: type III pantothenate kinase [Gammaproteobacteria bacterium]|jgi:type III pantothenate kinase|nr:type III pantothenate kinase [Gammaproteobacteria bacterium]